MVREMAIVIGTRPETLKMAPIINLLRAKGFTPTLVHTGQHHDYELCQQFIYELGLPHPSYDWRMPEEHNRRMVDHISDILFAPTFKTPDASAPHHRGRGIRAKNRHYDFAH